jgi:hypothetical protein
MVRNSRHSFASRFAGEMNFAVRWGGRRVGDQADCFRAAEELEREIGELEAEPDFV